MLRISSKEASSYMSHRVLNTPMALAVPLYPPHTTPFLWPVLFHIILWRHLILFFARIIYERPKTIPLDLLKYDPCKAFQINSFMTEVLIIFSFGKGLYEMGRLLHGLMLRQEFLKVPFLYHCYFIL